MSHMLENVMIMSFLTIVLVIITGVILLVLSGVFGFHYAKRRHRAEIGQLLKDTATLEQELAQLSSHHQQLKQEYAGLKYELGSLKRDKAYLDSKLSS